MAYRRNDCPEVASGGLVSKQERAAFAPTQMLWADTSGLFTGMFEVRVGDGCFAIRASE